MEETANSVDETLGLCSICRDPCHISSDDENGPSCTLGCTCRFHYECLVHYVRSKLGDRQSLHLWLESGHFCGVVCPNFVTEWCSYGSEERDVGEEGLISTQVPSVCEPFIIPFPDLRDLVEFGATLPISLQLTDVEKLEGWCMEVNEEASCQEISQQDEASSDPLIEATTKACPKCGYRATHPHGYACHHISPYGGCLNCKTQYCYKCLSPAEENERLRGHRARCRCGFWSNFCSDLTSADDIGTYLKLEPYPHDSRCGCVICSECRYRRPCRLCSGSCAVCLGFLPPGPSELGETYTISTASRSIASSSMLMSACRNGNLYRFKQLLDSLGPDEVAGVVNAQDNLGRTALHYLCDLRGGMLEQRFGWNDGGRHNASSSVVETMVSLLVRKCKADVLIADNSGRLAFHYALDGDINYDVVSIMARAVSGTVIDSLYPLPKESLILKAAKTDLRLYGILYRTHEYDMNFNVSVAEWTRSGYKYAKYPTVAEVLLNQATKPGNTPQHAQLAMDYAAKLVLNPHFTIRPGFLNRLIQKGSDSHERHLLKVIINGRLDVDVISVGQESNADKNSLLHSAILHGQKKILKCILKRPEFSSTSASASSSFSPYAPASSFVAVDTSANNCAAPPEVAEDEEDEDDEEEEEEEEEEEASETPSSQEDAIHTPNNATAISARQQIMVAGNAIGDTALHLALRREDDLWELLLPIEPEMLTCRNAAGQTPLEGVVNMSTLLTFVKAPKFTAVMDSHPDVAFAVMNIACCRDWEKPIKHLVKSRPNIWHEYDVTAKAHNRKLLLEGALSGTSPLVLKYLLKLNPNAVREFEAAFVNTQQQQQQAMEAGPDDAESVLASTATTLAPITRETGESSSEIPSNAMNRRTALQVLMDNDGCHAVASIGMILQTHPTAFTRDYEALLGKYCLNYAALQMLRPHIQHAPPDAINTVIYSDIGKAANQTVLHMCASSSLTSKNLLLLLREFPGTDRCINVPNMDGDTPLHIACRNSGKDIVEELLAVPNIDITIQNKAFQTASQVINKTAIHCKSIKKLLNSKLG